jgi:hypothetical protein
MVSFDLINGMNRDLLGSNLFNRKTGNHENKRRISTELTGVKNPRSRSRRLGRGARDSVGLFLEASTAEGRVPTAAATGTTS